MFILRDRRAWEWKEDPFELRGWSIREQRRGDEQHLREVRATGSPPALRRGAYGNGLARYGALPQRHRGSEPLVSRYRLQAALAPPHPLRTVRPTAWRLQHPAGEQDKDAWPGASRRVHRRFFHKRFHTLWRESRGDGDAVSACANGVPALKIEKLRKTYSNGFLALDGVSLEVEAGKFFGLLGPNGAGKTTLINGVVSLARPDSGSVEVFGKDAFREFREARRMIGVSPQEVNLDKFLTVEETLLFHAGYY